jgi:hypothetical protein
MKRLLLITYLLFPSLSWAAFTEFYATGLGTNVNAGSTTSSVPIFFEAGGLWTNASGWFFKNGIDLLSSNVAVGQWASVYPDASTENVFVGLITAVTKTNLVVSLSAKTGIAPADDFVGATTLRVGGAWRGPGLGVSSVSSNDASFPFCFVGRTLTNASGNPPRVNFKAGTFNVTNMYQWSNGAIVWSGYTTVPGDGGRVIFNGGLAGAAFTLLSGLGANNTFMNMEFDGNGGSGNASGAMMGSVETVMQNCIFRRMRNAGWRGNGGTHFVVSCESYSNNIGNIASIGGFLGGGTVAYMSCISHDNNSGISAHGYHISGNETLINCISYNNTGFGISSESSSTLNILNCDLYNNTLGGVRPLTGSSLINVFNCNFFKTGMAITNASNVNALNGYIVNCAFGSGTMANLVDIGPFTIDFTTSIITNGNFSYTANETPWTDPANGNFTIKSTATTKSAGRLNWTQAMVNSPTNTVGFIDVGAALSATTNATGTASGGYAFPFAQ